MVRTSFKNGTLAFMFALLIISSTAAGIRNLSYNDPLCHQYYPGGNACQICDNYAYLASNGKCQQVSTLCKTWNSTNGKCTSCFAGYLLSNGNCNTVIQNDPLCAKYSSAGTCQTCVNYAYLASNGKCQQVSTLCKTWNSTNGKCTSCFAGYVLSNGKCNWVNWAKTS
jgi:ABC-type thiamine transport system substrate-binding protein